MATQRSWEEQLDLDYQLRSGIPENNKLKIVDAINRGANLNHQDCLHGETPLHVAAQWGRYSALKLLLSKGGDPNVSDIFGKTVLHAACSQSDPRIVELILNKCPNLKNCRDNSGNTVLHSACSLQSNPAVVELLLNECPHLIHSTNEKGSTILHLAVNSAQHSIVKLLLHKGMDPNVSDNRGNTALYILVNNIRMEGGIKVFFPTLVVLLYVFPQLLHATNEVGAFILKDFLSKEIIDKAVRLIFLQAMKEKFVRVCVIQLLIAGAPAVGKSSFLRLLFNQPALMKHTSTGIATRSTQAINRLTGRDGTNIWEIVTDDMLYQMIAQCIQNDQLMPANNTDVLSISVPQQTQPSPGTVNSSADPLISDQLISNAITVSDDLIRPKFRDPFDFPGTVNSSVDPLISFIPDQLISHAITGTVSDDLIRPTWIHVTDSGGTPQFSDISRAFVRGNSVTVIAFKLTENLNKNSKFLYSVDGKQLNQPSNLQMSNLELIQHFVRSIVSSKYHLKIGFSSIEVRPYVVVLGTYHDHARMRQWLPGVQNLQQKNAVLIEALKEFEDHLIFFNDAAKELIFPVDNTCLIKRKEIASDIRSHVMQHGLGFRVDIPICWYIFELKLKEMVATSTHGIVTIDSCNDQLGAKLGMGRPDVARCIDYLASLSLFLHVPVLPNVIFTNPQYILDIISEVVSVSFISYNGTPLPLDIRTSLRNKGQFSESLLDVLKLPFHPPHFTKKHFLTLLIYTCVIACIEGGNYFIPIVLPTRQLTYVEKDKYRRCCEPLIMKFKYDIVPQGVFPTLVVSLLNRQEPPLFQLDSRCTQLRYSVGVCFDGGSILLVDSFTWMEVYYTGIAERCTLIRKVLDEALSTCAELLSYEPESIQYIPAVLCRQRHSEKVKVHTIDIKNESNFLFGQCTIDHTMPRWKVEDEKELCWFSITASSDMQQSINTSITQPKPKSKHNYGKSEMSASGYDNKYPVSCGVYDSGDKPKDSIQGTIQSSAKQVSTTHPNKYTKPELSDLIDLLAPLAYRYEAIGIRLKLPMYKLGLYHWPRFQQEDLITVLKYWIENGGEDGSPVTWDTIITAIDSDIIGNYVVVKKVKDFIGIQ